jgi:alpha-D-ribose 1-methylphosphonate 5-triphosphate synthase subunit PhnH
MSIFAPCRDSQSIYRTLLAAASNPGTLHTVQGTNGTEEQHHLFFQITTCLIDHEVTFSLMDRWREAMGRQITQLTGSRMVDWDQADFVIVNGGTSSGRIEKAQRGSLAYPDQGATVFYCIEDEDQIDPINNSRVRLSGPGIQHPISPQLEGLTVEEYRLLRDVNSSYPLGMDAFVIKGNDAIMGLPRSTRIEVE